MTRDVIRGEIGFDGLLMSDDLSMKALARADARRAAEAVIAAGSDLALHCNGDLAEMRAAAAGVPRLAGARRGAFRGGLGLRDASRAYDKAEALQLLASLMGEPTPIV